jgi:PAS domain S-box-containing protein
LDTYGYSLDELRRLTLRDLREHDTRGDFDRQVSQLDVRNGMILETLHQKKDGSTFPVESSIRAAELEGQKFHQSIIRDITERKRAAEALCASEVRYRRLFETAKDGILILDAETGMVVDVNPFLVERLGFSHEQFLGKEVWELGFFKDIIANHANFEELQQEEYIRYEDKPLKTAGGQQIDVEFVSNVYQVNHHKVIQCNIRDITERKRAEQALRASEERFRIAAETANDVVYEWDLKQSVQWPGKIDEMLGYEPGEFPRTLDGWATSVHPEDMERTMAAVHAHLEGRAPYMAEYRVRRKDGVYAWWSARGAAARTSDGKPVRWIGSITDITERKRAEEALRQSERLYRGIGESIDYGVWVCAPDGRNIYASESFLKLVGITQEQCSNFGWANVLHPEDAERTIAAWKECVRTGGTWDIEHRFRGVDGKWHAVLARGVPVRDEQGQITCWAGINLDITERKQAAEALRASEVRYRRLFEAARDGVLILDAETGMVVDVNPFLIGLLGYSRESFLGKEVWELGFFKDIFANQDHFAELQQKEYIRYEDRPLETADGRRIDVEFVSNVYLVNHEKVIQCNIRDITERRRAGKALQALSSRQEAILAAVPGIIMEVDTHKVYAWANQAGLAFFGDDVIGKEAACYFEGEQATYQSVQPLFDGHQDLIYVESWQRRKDGEKRLLAWWCRVLKDENGNVTGALSSAHDITEQRRATEALRESEEKFKCVFENSNAGMSITRPSGELQVNQAFCDLLGYSPAELRHQQWQALTHPEDLEPTQWMVDGLLAGKQDSARLTKRYLHKNGSVVWADVSTSLRRDEAGQPLYFIAIVTDFTARQRAEEEVRRLNQTLEQRVRDRTAQLEAANQELEAFSYSVSHDLRAPLRAIDGFTNILVEDYAQGLDEEGQRTLGIIRGEAKRMGELIDDLLAFSRMSREAIQSVEVDMGAVAQAMFDECAAQAPGRKLEFKLQPLPSAHGDQAMLRQVLANLLANAIKFTRYKAPAEIEIGGRVEGGEHVYYVKDNGVGFDIRYAHKLFGVFQRLHTEAEFEGTGVGLALVQRVIHRHGGRVWAEGKVNEGATFFFTLPGTNEEGRMKNEE